MTEACNDQVPVLRIRLEQLINFVGHSFVLNQLRLEQVSVFVSRLLRLIIRVPRRDQRLEDVVVELTIGKAAQIRRYVVLTSQLR